MVRTSSPQMDEYLPLCKVLRNRHSAVVPALETQTFEGWASEQLPLIAVRDTTEVRAEPREGALVQRQGLLRG